MIYDQRSNKSKYSATPTSAITNLQKKTALVINQLSVPLGSTPKSNSRLLPNFKNEAPPIFTPGFPKYTFFPGN